MREVALTRSARFSGGVGKILLTIFFLLVCTNTGHARQQSANNSKTSGPPSGQISGHVYSAATGQPLAKAVVSLEMQGDSNGPGHGDIETGSDGSFQFKEVAGGKYEISVSRCGYLAQTNTGNGQGDIDSLVSVGAGESRDGVSIYLVRGGVISGTVTDSDNEPVPGLQVEARAFPYMPGGGNMANFGAASSTTTDDLGNFRLIDLNSGSYFVVVGDNDAARPSSGSVKYREVYFPNSHSIREAQRVRVTAGEEIAGIHVAVKLERAFSLRGHAYGTCHSGADIYCAMFASNIGSFPTVSGPNQAAVQNGDFEIAGLFSGEYDVTATAVRKSQAEGYRYLGVGTVRIQVLDADAQADVSVGPLAQISGTVLDDSTRPTNQKNLQVSLMQISDPPVRNAGPRIFGSGTVERSTANPERRFQITGIEPGAYIFSLAALQIFSVDGPGAQVIDSGGSDAGDGGSVYVKEATCGGRDYAKEMLTVGPGERFDGCKIKIGQDTASMSGKVLNGDKGVAGQIIVAIPESTQLRRNPRYTLSGRTNREGQFSITGIIPGDYLVFAVTPNVEQSYYALDFAERNARDAERATFKPSEAKAFVLKPSSAQ